MYRRSIFTFIDILGFRQIVGKNKAEDVEEILKTLHEEAKPDKRISKMMEMSFLTFSDCTVRATPVESKANVKDPDGILWHEMLSLVHLQYRMAQRGHLIRGGMTIGDIFINKGMVFGPAMVQAYALESEFAVYPRIVIDPIIFTLFKTDRLLRCHDLKTEWEQIQQLIRKDSDGLYFIDYLAAIMTEFDEEGMEFDFLEFHRNLIIANASKELNKIAAKYLWLAMYHNSVVHSFTPEAFARFGLNRDEYVITHDDMPILFDHE